MSGSTSFGKKGHAAIDPTAVADVSPVSESDEIYIPGKANTAGDKQKKVKKTGGTQAQEKTEGKGKTETDTSKSQAKATSSS